MPEEKEDPAAYRSIHVKVPIRGEHLLETADAFSYAQGGRKRWYKCFKLYRVL
jgi:hypothetical protein